MGVSNCYKGCLKDVSRGQKSVSTRVSREYAKGVLMVLQRCIWVYQLRNKGVSRGLEGYKGSRT